MDQIVTRILQTEQAAEGALQEARGKAAELRSQADAESEKLLQQARQEAQERQRTAVKQVREEAEQARQTALQRIEEENRRFLEEQREAIQRTAGKIVSLLVQPQLPESDAEG